MTRTQKIEMRRSKLRERMGEIAGEEVLSEELRSELEGLESQYKDTEAQLRASMLADQTELPVAAETRSADPAFAELRSRSRVSAFFQAAASGLDVHGAEAELRTELLGRHTGSEGLAMPLAMLTDPREELRADAATTTAAHDGSTISMPIAQRVFATPAMASLGFNMPTVGAGQHEFLLITTGNNAANVREGSSRDTVAAAFRAVTLKPIRATAAVLLSREAIASVGPQLEQSLTTDIRSSLADHFEDVAINGDATSNAVVPGIITSVTATPSTDPAQDADMQDYAGLTAQIVDGKYANMDTDVSVLMGNQTFRHCARVVSTSGETTALHMLRQRAASLRVSAHMPVHASTITRTIMHRGSRPDDSYLPVWDGIELIRDPYSQARSGQVRITAVALFNAVILRTDAYVVRKLKIAV